jgi:phosphomannomutase
VRQLKIGTSSVRGVVGEALTPALIVNFASAFGTWCDGGAVVIGRDTRGSSAMLRAAVTAGLLASGCEVIDLGLCSTPLVSFAVRELGAEGGLSITGSHNDVEWNALKFVGSGGALLNTAKGEELLDIYHTSDFRLATWDRVGPVTSEEAVVSRYLEHLLAALDVPAIRAQRLAVAIDFCNGALAPVAARLLEALGCTLVALNAEPSGRFAHAPAPSVANMGPLAEAVRREGADLGAAINVDGDRLGLAMGEGVALSEEYVLPLAAAARLRRRPGTVVTNLSTSSMIEDVARAAGQRVVRTTVGENQVVDRGLLEEAVLAGEGNGGVAVLPGSTTFDALLTLGLVLEELAVTGLSLRALVDRIPPRSMRKHELASPPNLTYRVVEGFRVRYAELAPDCSDGVRVTWPDGWLHVRASNTEPLLRIIAEATTPARCNALFDEALTHALGALGGEATAAP